MKAIGIRELKSQLSRYLREVAAGEIVLVTDRGTVIAELRAPGHVPETQESEADRRLRRMAARYALRVGEPHDPGVYQPSPVQAPPGSDKALLEEERDENDRLR